MTEQESKNLIRETFESDFNKERFKRFTANLLTDYSEKSFKPNVKDSFREDVESYELIGSFIDSSKRSLDVLIVYLRKDSTFAARTLQRNLALHYLRNVSPKDGVLVAYIHKNKKDWRFSFVKLESEVVKNDDGKIRDIDVFTAAKRSSFLVGSNEKSYTAKKQFLPIIQREEQPKFEDIEEAFSVETVTKEFFNKYRELFHNVHDALEKEVKKKPQLKEEFEKKEVATVDFAKKLLGQMVFLYFLQKKGWFGVKEKERWGTGPKNFLRELFKEKDKYGKNFFNDVLEPLFYEALAQDNREGDIYPRLNNWRMPFLNGGLFEPMRGYSWKTTDIFLPDDLFSNKRKDGEDIGDGILDVFDRYNFTVNESDPLEKEVAVDPEMLGKVFENLLDVKDRKSKGSFYTPREIVHYMCQECLINYLETETKGEIPREDIENLVLNGEAIIHNDFLALKRSKDRIAKYGKDFKDQSYKILLPESIRENARKIDELLKDIKVCDPAVGSGAFPLGMINEIVGARQVLQVYLRDKLSVYDLKYHAIANSIHGVDIDPGAVDISRLRLWLSLVVEEKEPKALPNLEHRIMQGNSLLSSYEGIKMFDIDILSTKEEKNIQFGLSFGTNSEIKMDELQNKAQIYLSETQRTEKQQLKREIENIKWELIEETLREQGKQLKIKEIRKLKGRNTKPFFVWELEFLDVFAKKGGFDIVIGNPPYVRADDPTIAEQREMIKESNEYITLWEKWDLYVAFIERGFKLLRKNGVLEFIIPDAYMSSKYSKKSHKYFLENSDILKINFLSDIKVFEAEVKNLIIEIRKSREQGHLPRKIRHFPKFENFHYIPSESQEKMGEYTFRIENSVRYIGNLDHTLEWKEICYVSVGLVLQADEKNFRGAFIKKDLIKDEKDKTHFKPYVEAKWLSRYCLQKIKYLEWDTERVPSKIRRPTFPELYDRPKIMMGGMTGSIYDKQGLLSNHSIIISVLWKDLEGVLNKSITGSMKKDFSNCPITNLRKELERNSMNFKLKYLLAILNSKVGRYYLEQFRRSQIGFYPNDLKKLPIKIVSEQEQRKYIDIVEKIIALTSMVDYSNNPISKKKTEKYERQLDMMIYELYSLTKEEMELVEKSTKS